MDINELKSLAKNEEYARIVDSLKDTGLYWSGFKVKIYDNDKLTEKQKEAAVGLISNDYFDGTLSKNEATDLYFGKKSKLNFVIEDDKGNLKGISKVGFIESETKDSVYPIMVFDKEIQGRGFYSLLGCLRPINDFVEGCETSYTWTRVPMVVSCLDKWGYEPLNRDGIKKEDVDKMNKVLSTYFGHPIDVDGKMIINGNDLLTSQAVPKLKGSRLPLSDFSEQRLQ